MRILKYHGRWLDVYTYRPHIPGMRDLALARGQLDWEGVMVGRASVGGVSVGGSAVGGGAVGGGAVGGGAVGGGGGGAVAGGAVTGGAVTGIGVGVRVIIPRRVGVRVGEGVEEGVGERVGVAVGSASQRVGLGKGVRVGRPGIALAAQ